MLRLPVLSSRLKLLLACLLIEVAMVGLLLGNGLALLQGELRRQGELRILQFGALADATLVGPLAQRDHAGLRQALDLMQRADAIRYLVLLDHRGQPLTAAGRDPGQPLPPVDARWSDVDIDRPGHTVHLALDLQLAGQHLGTLRYGFGTDFLRAAREQMLWRSLPMALGVLVVGTALLALMTGWLTRQLSRLAAANERLSAGDFSARAEVVSDDDLGRLALGFNAMAESIQQRVQDLQASEQLQRQHRALAQDEHARLQALLEAMDSAILFVDADERVRYANGAFHRLWRLSTAQAQSGRSLAELAPLLLAQFDEAGGRHRLLRQLPAGPLAERSELHTRDDRH